jgi:NADPH-dependent ferric siderophore reductase
MVTAGPASKWAREAEAGSKLGIMMRTEEKELCPTAEWYLLAGDATAIPVLSAILETLPETAKGVCIIEVHGKQDEQPLNTKADIEFKWLHNAEPHVSSEMADKVKNITIPETTKFGYVAAEFSR